jgi:hypothetical protein
MQGGEFVRRIEMMAPVRFASVMLVLVRLIVPIIMISYQLSNGTTSFRPGWWALPSSAWRI